MLCAALLLAACTEGTGGRTSSAPTDAPGTSATRVTTSRAPTSATQSNPCVGQGTTAFMALYPENSIGHPSEASALTAFLQQSFTEFPAPPSALPREPHDDGYVLESTALISFRVEGAAVAEFELSATADRWLVTRSQICTPVVGTLFVARPQR